MKLADIDIGIEMDASDRVPVTGLVAVGEVPAGNVNIKEAMHKLR